MLEQYKTYENIPGSGDKSGKVTIDIFKEDTLIDFFSTQGRFYHKHNSITPFSLSIITCRIVRIPKQDTHFMTSKKI